MRVYSEKRKAYQRQYRRNHRDKGREALKQLQRKHKLRAIAYKGGECVDCGFDDLTRPEVFQFDHLPQFEKAADICKIIAFKWETLVKELDKCELTCANCHATRTARRLRGA